MSGIDWNLFWHMGGHGLYVWGGWCLAALALGAEFVALWRRARRRVFSAPAPEAASGHNAQERP